MVLYAVISISARAQSDQQTHSSGPENGTLLIIGGSAQDIFYSKFQELVGGPDAPIVIIPTAATSDSITSEMKDAFKQRFLDRGFNKVTVLHTRNLEDSNTDEFVRPIKQAKGIWFSGGRQWRHADSYLNTLAHKEFFELLDRGGVIAGSSAGATIQGSYLARGDTRANTIMMGDHEEGLAFLNNVAIDQHLFARNRQFDMFEILDHRPELLGLGIDENTGIIVQGNRFTVFGASYVVVYDGTRWSAERDTIYRLPPGSREFYMLRRGQEYDLGKRKVIQFADRSFIDLNQAQMNEYCGKYRREKDGNILNISIKEDELYVTQWNDYTYNLEAESPTKFYSTRFGLNLEFEIEGDEVMGFAVLTHGDYFEKVH